MQKLILVIALFSSFVFGDSNIKVLRIYNFNDYIDKNVLVNFAKENKIKLIYEIYENNDELYSKIKNNKVSFDLACPSANFIGILNKGNYLADINTSKLKNFKNINPLLLNQSYDKGNHYSIPYFWGTIGIVYDKTKVKPINSWNDLWRSDLQNTLLIGSDYRDMFGVVLKSLGYSANTQNSEEIAKAYEKLLQLIPNIKAISSDSVSKYFLKDNFSAGIVFNGDAKTINNSKNDFLYIYPKEGAIGWIDSFVILKNTQNIELAYKFIDYILEARNGLLIANEIGYATANIAAYKLQDQKIKQSNIIYPQSSVISKSEVLQNVYDSDEVYKKYWGLFLEKYKATKDKK